MIKIEEIQLPNEVMQRASSQRNSSFGRGGREEGFMRDNNSFGRGGGFNRSFERDDRQNGLSNNFKYNQQSNTGRFNNRDAERQPRFGDNRSRSMTSRGMDEDDDAERQPRFGNNRSKPMNEDIPPRRFSNARSPVSRNVDDDDDDDNFQRRRF